MTRTAGAAARGALVAAAALAALLGGCAKSEFPPGGPVDTVPPRIMLTSPADSSTRVPLDGEIEILFSEGMEHTSVRDGFKIYPPPGVPSFHWNGRRLRVSWAERLKPGTTYQAFLSAGARDLHGVPLGVPLTLRFSTGDSLDPGRIRGVLRAKTLPTKGVPIQAYPESLGLRPDYANVPPVYATETDTTGAYLLSGLPLGRGFTIHAVYDLNRNGAYDSLGDVAAPYPGVIRLTPDHPLADSINLVAVNPAAPASVGGIVDSPDSTVRFRVEARSDSDSTFVRFAERRGPGKYLLHLPPGRYRIRALRVPGTTGLAPAEIRRTEPLVVSPEGDYEHVDFRFDRAERVAPAPKAQPPPEPGE